jgi:hypothetical protein
MKMKNNNLLTVEIISSEMLFSDYDKVVKIFFKRQGLYSEESVCVRRPTLLEKIVVTKVTDRFGSLPEKDFSIKSLIDYAYFPRHFARDLLFRVKPVIHLEGSILDFRSKEPNNIAHLLLDIIPYYLYVKTKIKGPVILLLQSLSQPFASLLDYFGVETFVTHSRVKGDFVRIWGSRGLSAYELKDVFDCLAINFFPWVYVNQKICIEGRPEKIFLARRGQRKLLNHDTIEHFLQQKGYVTIFMEDYPITEQLALGAAAKHVVAVHGAAMSCLIMATQVHSIVEISPPHVYHHFYPMGLSSIVERYAMTIQNFDDKVIYNGWSAIWEAKQKPFEADISLLAAALESVSS